MQIERNEVNVKPLLAWGKHFNILNSKNEVVTEIHMRLVGDADLNRARIYALRKSAEKRKSLRTENSDDRFAFIQERGTLERERLVALCALFAAKDLAKEALKEVNVPEPKEPKADASLEKQELYQKQIDEYPAKVDAALREYINKRIEELTVTYETRTDDELYDMYVGYFTDQLCEAEMLTAFKEMCTYYGTFSDDKFKNRFFESFEEFVNLDSNLKQQFIGGYESLEINPEELKKLQVATL